MATCPLQANKTRQATLLMSFVAFRKPLKARLVLLIALFFFCSVLTVKLAYVGSNCIDRNQPPFPLLDHQDDHGRLYWMLPVDRMYWMETYASMHNNAIRSLPDTGRNRFLIYVCDGECGGLGDRLSGLMSVFYLAIALQRIFLIEYTSPVDLELTLVPNRINWNSSKLLPQGLHTEGLTLIDTPNRTGALLHLEQMHAADTQVIRVKNNRYWLGMYLWLQETNITKNTVVVTSDTVVGERATYLRGALSTLQIPPFGTFQRAEERSTETFAFGFSFLFHFSPEVKLRSLEIYKELDVEPAKHYVAIHARIGGRVQSSSQASGWDDPERHKLEDIDEFISCAKSKASHIIGSSPIVLFSDNEELKTLVSSQNVKTIYSSRLIHVDKSVTMDSAEMVQGNIDTFAELHVLSKASCLVGSHSTFSGLASSVIFPPTHCFSFFSSCERPTEFWQEAEELP